MNTNIKKQLSEINALLKLYNESSESLPSFYLTLKERARFLKKEKNFNKLAKECSNLLKNKKIALQEKKNKKNIDNLTLKINNKKNQIKDLFEPIKKRNISINSGKTNSENNESAKKEESTKKKDMINYSSKIIRGIYALIKLREHIYIPINKECFNKLHNLKKTHENFIESISSSKNINEIINKKYSNLKNKTKNFYSKYQLKYSNN